METIAQEAKRLLDAVPEDRWGTKKYLRSIKSDSGKLVKQCCAAGHLSRVKHGGRYTPACCNNIDDTEKLNEAYRTFSGDFLGYIFDVNDEKTGNYQQETPKERILALLDDMIAAGY